MRLFAQEDHQTGFLVTRVVDLILGLAQFDPVPFFQLDFRPEEVVGLAGRHGLPIVADLGSGCLAPRADERCARSAQ